MRVFLEDHIGTIECSTGKLNELRLNDYFQDCGIDAMLSYLCLIDKDIMMTDDTLVEVQGYQFDAPELQSTDPIRIYLGAKQCTTIAYANLNEFKLHISGNWCTPEDQDSFTSIFRALIYAAWDAGCCFRR